MKFKDYAIAFGLGIVVGYLVKQKQEDDFIKPEVALKITRQRFQERYDVSGSWIYMKKEQLMINDLPYEVYHGGITKHIDGEHIPIEFFIDARTGTVVKTKERQQ